MCGKNLQKFDSKPQFVVWLPQKNSTKFPQFFYKPTFLPHLTKNMSEFIKN
jgi:hypothetical protein